MISALNLCEVIKIISAFGLYDIEAVKFIIKNFSSLKQGEAISVKGIFVCAVYDGLCGLIYFVGREGENFGD